MPDVVIRTDASLEIGTGHVMRCLALADILRDAGHEVSFVTRALPGHLGDRIGKAGFDVTLLPAAEERFIPGPEDPAHAAWAGVPWQEDARAMNTILQDRKPEWLIVDHYALDARWEQAVAGHVGRVMVWDDLADRPHSCDLLLDQNLGRTAQTYAGLVPSGTRVLTGPRYAVLRPEFSRLREAGRAARPGHGLHRIMVAMGGVDRQNTTAAVLDVLAELEDPGNLKVEVIMGRQAPALESVQAKAASMPISVDVSVDVPDMALRMARADLAIGAAGGTAWERCALGLPSLLLVIAENQRPAADALAATGAAVVLGEVDDPLWTSRLARWITDPARDSQLPRMAAAAAAVCDGAGGRRVAAEIRRPAWRLRDAGKEDTRTVYDWRYGEGPDRFAQNPSVPDYPEHAAWFARALASDAYRIKILEVDGAPCGYIRLDVKGTSATVSLWLAPAIRGQGWGAVLLDDAVRMGTLLGLSRLAATVHVENAASLRLFETAGYEPTVREHAFQGFTLEIGEKK